MRRSLSLLLACWPVGIFGYIYAANQSDSSNQSVAMIDPNAQFESEVNAALKTAIPEEYTVSIYPQQPDFKKFKGVVTIKLRGAKDARTIALHVGRMRILSLSLEKTGPSDEPMIDYLDHHRNILTDKVDMRTSGQDIRASTHTDTHLKIDFAESLKENVLYELSILYRGYASSDHHGGLIAYQDNSTSVLYTAFGPRGASSVLPCYNDPSYRTPFTLQIIHNEDQKAVFGRHPLESKNIRLEKGLIATQFEESPPMAIHEFSFALLGGYTTVYRDHSAIIKLEAYVANQSQHLKYVTESALSVIETTLYVLLRLIVSPFPFKSLRVIFIPNPNIRTTLMPTWGLLVLSSSNITDRWIPTIHLLHQLIQHWIDIPSHHFSSPTYGMKEAAAAWLANNRLQKYRPRQQVPSFFDEKKDSMALDYLDENRRLLDSPLKYEYAARAKRHVFMNMIQELIGNYDMLESVKTFITTEENESFGSILDRVSNQNISEIMNPWIMSGGLPFVRIVRRTGNKILLSTVAKTFQNESNVIPVYVHLYMKGSDGKGYHQRVLLTKKTQMVDLEIPDTPFVFIESATSDYSYYKPMYSNLYLEELARNEAMPHEDKVELLETLQDNPGSILWLAKWWKENRPLRLPIIKALHSVVENHIKGSKSVLAAIRKIQRELIQKEMKDLKLDVLKSGSSYEKLVNIIESQDHRALGIYNETCVLDIFGYEGSCKYLVHRYLEENEDLPEPLAFGALKAVVKNEKPKSDKIQSTVSLADSPSVPWYIRVSAARALGSDDGSKASKGKIHYVLDKLSKANSVLEPQNGQSAIFTQMLETMETGGAASRYLWQWVESNWDSQIGTNPLLRDSVLSSSIGKLARSYDSVCGFFTDRDLTLQEKTSINHDIIMTTYRGVVTFIELPSMNRFLRTNGYLKKGVTKRRDDGFVAGSDLKLFTSKFGEVIPCHVS